MARGLNEFLKGLKFESGETSQIEVAEEAIKKELFTILSELNLENGQTIKINKVVQLIANNLGINANKMQIEQIVTKVFSSGHYCYKINDNGDIEADFNTADILQKQHANQAREQAVTKLHEFVYKVEQFVGQLSQQKVPISVVNLQAMFSKEEQEQHPIWIDLAIDTVLGNLEQEK